MQERRKSTCKSPRRQEIEPWPLQVSPCEESLQYVLFLPYVSTCMYRVGNGNDHILSEEHFEKSKVIRGSYLFLEPFSFVHIFEFYLVTQTL
jgi:hypothetical protein